MSILVGEKSQATVQALVDDHVEIRFYPPEHTRSLRGALKKYATRIVSNGELREAREKAWDEAVTMDWNREISSTG
jgi:hypothetical protein